MEEILAAPGMSGFVSILDPPEQVPHLQALVDDIKHLPLATLPEAVLKAPGGERVPDVEKVRGNKKDPETVPTPVPLKTSGTGKDTPYSLPRAPAYAAMLNGRYIRRAVSARDGHSAGEEILYQALWNCSMARPETEDSKLLTIGWKAMSRLARLTPRNTKRNCQNLIAKLAIEQLAGENSRESIGRTYRLYSYRAIEERRRAAGMLWVTRSRGVEFVPAPPELIQPQDPGGERDREIIGDTGSQTILEAGQLPVPIAQILREYLPDSDERAAMEIVRLCREKAPSASDEEIAYFFRQKAELMCRMGTVKSPWVFLKAAVPRCFEGDALRQLREMERKRLESLRTGG